MINVFSRLLVVPKSTRRSQRSDTHSIPSIIRKTGLCFRGALIQVAVHGDNEQVPSQIDMDCAYAIAVTNMDRVVDEINAAQSHTRHPDVSSSPPTVETSAEDVADGLTVHAKTTEPKHKPLPPTVESSEQDVPQGLTVTAEPTREPLPCLCQ